MAIPRNKSDMVAELIRKRLEHGDYSLTDIPAERTLALEHHVAYKTLRRAVQLLIDEGLLVRRANGRLARNPKNSKGRRPQIAFLMPAFSSPVINDWCMAAERICKKHHAVLRPVTYVHWDDTIIRNTLNGFDGIFLYPSSDPMSDRIIARLKQSRHPVVVLELDVSAAGIPSLCAFPPESIQLLLDHLAALGHRQVDCLNTQPMSPEVELRIQQWQIWLKAHGFKGRLLNHPVPSYEHIHDTARQVILRELDQGEPLAGAMICTTLWSAVGAMRAFHDRKIRIGVDISVAAVNGEGVADCLCPSLTALEPGDPTPTLSVCLDWMTSGGKAWIGPLRVQVPGTRVAPRESTGRPAVTRVPPKTQRPARKED
jgi:DNA-binding LacI/PurR family transcriptional regulator